MALTQKLATRGNVSKIESRSEVIHMGCPIGEDLKNQWRLKHQISQSSSAQDKLFFPHHRISPKQAKQKAADAKNKTLHAFRVWGAHLDQCKVCKPENPAEGWQEPLSK